MTVKIAMTAQYQEDGDMLSSVVYVSENNKKTIKIKSGIVWAKVEGRILQTIKFDSSYGNKDGSFNFCFNHPVVKTPQVHVQITMPDDSVHDQVCVSYVLGTQPVPLSRNT